MLSHVSLPHRDYDLEVLKPMTQQQLDGESRSVEQLLEQSGITITQLTGWRRSRLLARLHLALQHEEL